MATTDSADRGDLPAAPPDLAPVAQTIARLFAVALTLAAVAWSADLFRAVGIVILQEQFMAAMFGVGLALVYIHFPFVRGTSRVSVPWYDWIAGALAIVVGAYLCRLHRRIWLLHIEAALQ